MTLTPGTKPGPYQITGLIGKGGMGEVYKAHDPRLGRDVAIKVAGEAFSERFTREARAITPLNHSNYVYHLCRPVPLFRPSTAAGGTDITLGAQYDVSRDGRFLVNLEPQDAAATAITLIQNWKAR